jgi:hypothetical protein
MDREQARELVRVIRAKNKREFIGCEWNGHIANKKRWSRTEDEAIDILLAAAGGAK